MRGAGWGSVAVALAGGLASACLTFAVARAQGEPFAPGPAREKLRPPVEGAVRVVVGRAAALRRP